MAVADAVAVAVADAVAVAAAVAVASGCKTVVEHLPHQPMVKG